MPTTLDIVPYCGIVIATSEKTFSLVSAVSSIKNKLTQAINAQWQGHKFDQAMDGGRFLTSFFYYHHTPHWAPSSNIQETTQSYFTVGQSNGYIVFHCSDNQAKDIVLEELESAAFPANRVRREVLNFAFIEGSDVKSIWLHGIHKKTSVKADSKALTGLNLRFALDPSADQTYSYDSLRGIVSIEKKDKTFGINLSESYIWLYRLSSWKEFISKVDILTTKLKGARGRSTSTPIETVSHPISDANLMLNAYDIAILDPDNPANSNFGQIRMSLLEKIKNEFDYELYPGAADNVLRIKVHHISQTLKSYIGDVHAQPEIFDSRLKFNLSYHNNQPGQLGKLKEFSRAFLHTPLVQVWYESGHAIAGGACYEMSYSDAPFNGMYWAIFPNTDILKEKPDHQPMVNSCPTLALLARTPSSPGSSIR